MELNLTIDQGNSSAKIVLWDGQTAVEKLTVSKLTRETLEDVAERMRPARALVCSVTGNGPRMARWLGERGIKAREVTAGMPLPITIGYSTPATLGEDRVAAAAGAWHLFPGEMSLVVDMGTAVTYDVVSERGEFIGGNIAPGVGMRLRALRSFTARLPEVGGYGETPVFGNDTVTAMRAGAIRGVVAEIGYYRSQLPEGARVVLTGGWAERVSQFLDFPVTVDSCLVTKGLLCILLYNEDKTH